MDITPQVAKEKQLIHSYGNGGFKISGVAYNGSVIVLPDVTLTWALNDFSALAIEHFEPLLKLERPPEILLIGCGATHGMLSPHLRQQLKQAGILADAMSTGAACRTYNILLAEGRQVAAALIAI